MKIGFLGMGNMGQPMARNLLRAGHEVTVYNRTRQRATALEPDGARVASTPAEAATGVEVLISMLADDAAVRAAVLDDAITALAPGAVHMSSSTISIGLSRELAEHHQARGQGYIAVPVIGRAEAAAAKKLWMIAAGPSDLVEYCSPILEDLGRGASLVGAEPWKANLVKIGVNFMLASMIEALGESCALMEKHGVDVLQFLGVVNGGAFQSPIFENYGKLLADRRFHPAGFALRLGLKDTELALDAAKAGPAPLPIAGLLRDRYLEALALGQGELDWCAIADLSRLHANVTHSEKAGG